MTLAGSPASYRWRAQGLPLDGLELALPPKGRFEGLYGRLSGEGTLGLQPLEMAGAITLDQPGLLGLQLRQARLEGRYRNRGYQLTGELLPPETGQVLLEAKGLVGGGLEADLDAQGLSARWLTRGLMSLSELNRDSPDANGHAADLGTLLVDTFGGAIDGQLKALRQLQAELAARDDHDHARAAFQPEDLRGQMDAQIKVSGPSLADLNLDLKARGHLWVKGEDVDHALQIEPFVATLAARCGMARVSFPSSICPHVVGTCCACSACAAGRAGAFRHLLAWPASGPELTTELVLENVSIGAHRLSLEKGQITLWGKPSCWIWP